MSRRLSSASTSGYCLCFVSPLAIRGPSATLGFVTISNPVAPLCLLASLVLVQPLGMLPSSIPSLILVRRVCPRASLFPARPSGLSPSPVLVRPVPVKTCVIGAALGLITVSALGAALASVVSGAGTALVLVTVSMWPLCPLPPLALVQALGVLPSVLMVRPKCPLPLLVVICDPSACEWNAEYSYAILHHYNRSKQLLQIRKCDQLRMIRRFPVQL